MLLKRINNSTIYVYVYMFVYCTLYQAYALYIINDIVMYYCFAFKKNYMILNKL